MVRICVENLHGGKKYIYIYIVQSGESNEPRFPFRSQGISVNWKHVKGRWSSNEVLSRRYILNAMEKKEKKKKIGFLLSRSNARPSSRLRSTPNAAYIVLLRTYLVHVCTRGTRRSFGVRIYHTIVRTTPRFPTHFSLSTDDKDRPRFKRYQRLFASSLANRTWPEKSRDFKGSRSSRSIDERFYLIFLFEKEDFDSADFFRSLENISR